MGPFNYGHNPNKNDVIAFLNQTAKDSNWPHVINDITVGDEQGTTTITRRITVKDNCVEFAGEFNVSYTIINKINISNDLTTTTLYDTSSSSLFISEPPTAKIMARIKELNANVNINQIDLDARSFGYDSTNDMFKVKIIPQTWSSIYTGEQYVYWKPGLSVNFGTWPPVPEGYGETSVSLSLSKPISSGAIISFTFSDGSTVNTNFTISGNRSLELKLGQRAGLYSCDVKATISGDPTYIGETISYSTSVGIGAQLVDPKMTANSSNGFVASASTSQFDGPYKAFDGIKSGNQSNYWCGTNYGKDWIQIELPQAKVLTFYSLTSMYLTSPNNWTDTNFKTWQVWGSDDKTFARYEVLDTQTDIRWNAYPETQTFNLPGNSMAFSCYRISITACQANHDGYTTVAEIEYYGY